MGIARSYAEALDRADALAVFRERFVIDDDVLVYLDGNSLGRLPRAARDRVIEVLDDDWGKHLIRSWDNRWIDLPQRIGDLIGTELLGARPGEVIVGDTTTVALYKALAAALDARPGRVTVVIERDNFPTDRYVVESLAQQRDLTIRWLAAAGPEGVSVEALEDELDETVAVAVLSHVDYRSAALLDMGAMTAALHRHGALALWDLSHSAGAVPIDLSGDEVDLAVGCTYKYLNGGPGAPAYTYVRAERQAELTQPIWGWWSRVDMFDMEQGYEPQPDVRSWLTGTPSVLSMAAIEPGVAMVAEATLPAIRAKSQLLMSLAVELYDELLAPRGFGLGTSRHPGRRGSHLTVTHRDAREASQHLIDEGIIPDFRRPDGIRLGLAPLTTRFVDVHDSMTRLSVFG
ncbi:MAG: kynureninase [Propionibacteriales bacterium]|nr:kynureninase [Propionibacteriales bacterium]